MPQRAVLASIALLVILGAARESWASAAAKLTYVRESGAERCADESELRRAVAARVGYDLFFPWAQKTVVVEVRTASPRGYHGLVQIVDERGLVVGQRSLDSTSDDCADLTRALALAISIAVDDRTLEYVPPQPAPETAATPAAVDPATAQPAPSTDSEPPTETAKPSPPLAPSLAFSASITPLVSFGTAPSPAVGAEADAVVRYGNASLSLGARADAPAPGAVPSGGTVTTWLVAATVAPCWHGPLRTSYCALALAGWYSAEGQVPSPNQDGEPFVAVGGRIGLDVPLSRRVFVLGRVDAFAALTRFDVTVSSTPVFHVPPASAAVGAGLGVVF